MRGLREGVAHVATPWAWRSRTSVVVLVVAMVALTVAMIASAWADDWNKAVATILCGGLGALVGVRPAVRSLHRWDQVHGAPRSSPTTGDPGR